MKRVILVLALFLYSAIGIRQSAFSQVPSLINYQGRLLNGTNLVNGPVGLSLRLYDASAGGTELYEDSNTVTVADGLYATFIGDDTTFGDFPTALASTNVWIEVAVNGVALTPRERLVSAAYAVRAQQAQVFTGLVLDSQLSANIARLDGTNQSFSGPVNFTSASNAFNGTFFGNGAGVTNVQLASIIAEQLPVIAWGRNDDGQSAVPASATSVVVIAGGGYHNLALRGDGTVIAWGYNGSGQTNVPASATGVVAIAGGGSHSLALCSNGTVIAWGYNAYGQTNVPVTATGVVAIAGGGGHSLALRADGQLIAWGYNVNGQTNVPATATGVVAIAGGMYHSLALRGDGTVIAWGYNAHGQTNVPASATGVVAVACGELHSLALRSDGTVIAWGYNVNGQTNVPATATGVVAIAAGYLHNLALRNDGTVIGWGYDAHGQANGPANAAGVVAISCGGYHNLAIRAARGSAQVALLDRANTFAGTVTAASFAGNGAGLTNIGAAALADEVQTNISARLDSNVWAAAASTTNFTRRTGDTMTGALNLPAGGLTVGTTQLVVTAAGNVGIGTANPPHLFDANVRSGTGIMALGDVHSTNALLYMTANVGGGTNGTVGLYSRNSHDLTFISFPGDVLTEWLRIKGSNGNVGIGTANPTNKLHVVGTVQATAYITGSDVHSKENITPVSAQEILAKVAGLPMNTWTFKDDPHSGRHLGPMAQDFRAAFGLGNTDSGIFTVDADGVALAAIQALATQNAELRMSNAELKARTDALEARLRALEAR